MNVCVHACKVKVQCLHWLLSTYLVRHGLSFTLDSLIHLGWPISSTDPPASLYPTTHTQVTSMYHHAQLITWILDSGPHDWMAGTLLAEPSSQPLHLTFLHRRQQNQGSRVYWAFTTCPLHCTLTFHTCHNTLYLNISYVIMHWTLTFYVCHNTLNVNIHTCHVTYNNATYLSCAA